MHVKIFSSSTLSPSIKTKSISRHCHMFPSWRKPPVVEQQWSPVTCSYDPDVLSPEGEALLVHQTSSKFCRVKTQLTLCKYHVTSSPCLPSSPKGNSTSPTSACLSVPYRHTHPGFTMTPMLTCQIQKAHFSFWEISGYLIWTLLTAFPTFLIGRACLIHSPWIQIPRRQAGSPKIWFALRPSLSQALCTPPALPSTVSEPDKLLPLPKVAPA